MYPGAPTIKSLCTTNWTLWT